MSMPHNITLMELRIGCGIIFSLSSLIYSLLNFLTLIKLL